MDEPGWEWPAWRFGLKREDLFGKLHDQYNTVASSIQDPEAFHHDVYEISHAASSVDEFHRLLSARRELRLRELNESLESAAVEIIANPKLIGTEQWQYALQLFRTKSLDSLVRYFASYLPEGHFYRGHYDSPSSTGSSFAETCSVNTASTKPSTIDDVVDVPATISSFFPDDEDKPILTHEPFDITSSAIAAVTVQLPPSPRSMTMRSDTSVSSPSADDMDAHDYSIATCTPARSLSFSGSESERFAPADCDGRRHLLDDEDDEALETSQSDFETPITSDEELTDSRSSLESDLSQPDSVPLSLSSISSQSGKHEAIPNAEEEEEEFPPAQLPSDMFDELESETPTPRQEPATTSYMESKPILPRSYRASSPRLRRREGSPLLYHGGAAARRSPEESFSRIQKPMPDPIRVRPKGRRRAVDC